MDSYSKYLAENVLSEDKVVTYRLLSRALQVHVNTAKQMLYEFHRSQNVKRPGAVHATYLVYGTKKAVGELSQNGSDGDVEMTSSAPEHDSFPEAVPTSTLSLVPEEQLREVLAEFEEVSCIHVYSLGPHPTKDMALLADVVNEVVTLDTGKDQRDLVPITNSRVRRRERHGPGLRAAAAASPAAVKPQATAAFSKTAPASAPVKVKEELKSSQPEETADKTSSSVPTKKPPTTVKRGAGSGIMQAFSKAAAKPPKPKKEAESSKSGTPSAEESHTQPLSDDGDDDEDMPQPKPRSTAGYKTKKQREEELRRMMEEDEEEGDDEEKVSEAESPAEEPMEEELPAPEPAKEEEAAEIVTATTNGRRRGKRRVMRKKQIMDDQGYLVTIQEQGWESFSEDEPPASTKPKMTSSAPPAPAPAPAAKPKKGGSKGQGSIMSFFSKK
ncbi:hypothetical protein VTI74DRAFT_58 [Chaetomium olivicolor]